MNLFCFGCLDSTPSRLDSTPSRCSSLCRISSLMFHHENRLINTTAYPPPPPPSTYMIPFEFYITLWYNSIHIDKSRIVGILHFYLITLKCRNWYLQFQRCSLIFTFIKSLQNSFLEDEVTQNDSYFEHNTFEPPM